MQAIPSLSVCLLLYGIYFHSKVNTSFLKLISLQWFLVLLLYWVNDSVFVSFSPRFDYIFILFFITLVITYLATFKVFCIFDIFTFKKYFSVNVLYSLCFITSFYSLFLFFTYLYDVGSMKIFRAALLEDGLSLRVGISFPLCAAAYLYASFYDKKKSKYFATILWLLAVVSTSKIFIVLSMLYVSGFYKKDFRLNYKKVFIFVSAGFLLFSIVHLLQGKIAGGSDRSLFGSLCFTLLGYTLGGLAAFQSILDGDFILRGDVVAITLNKFNVLASSKLMAADVTLADGWVKTGEWLGNVYTGLATWHMWNNTYGVVVFGAVVGVTHGIINAFTGNGFLFLRVFSYYPLIFIIFAEQYLMGVDMWIAFSCAAIILGLTKLPKGCE